MGYIPTDAAHLTPLECGILLHYFCIAEPHPRIENPVHRSAADMFLASGVFTSAEHGYRTTEKGDAWVRAILMTPMPEQAWITKDGTRVG